MRRQLSRTLKPCVAVLLAASFLAWQPVMTARMAATDAGTSHSTHTPAGGGHQHHAIPLQCCTLCTIACAAAPGIPGTAAVWTVDQVHPDVRPAVDTDVHHVSKLQHRLPFPVGPPTLLLA